MNVFGFNISREIAGMQGGITTRGVDVDAAMSALREAPAQPQGNGCDCQQKKVRSADFADKSVRVNSQEKALAVSAWYCGLARKANIFAQLILEYQKHNDKAHGDNYEVYRYADAKNMNYLVQVRPNPLMTASELWAQAVIDREVYGNAIIYVERDEYGEVKYLWLCNSATLDIARMTYLITYNLPYVGPISKEVPERDIIHWANTYRRSDKVTGMGTLRYAAQSLSTAATNDKQTLESAAKGGRYKVILKEEQQPDFALNLLNKEQREGAKDDFQEQLSSGADVIAYNGLMDAKVISQTNNDLSLLDMRKFDVPTVARFLQVPLVLLMDYTNNTYKAPEQAMQAFLQHTIGPMARELEMEFNSKLVGKEAFLTLRFHFNDKELTRLDPKGRMEIAKMQLECGIKCVNELRAEFDLPALEEYGDRHLVSTNLQPLDDLKVGVANTLTDNANNNANANKNKEDDE